MINKRKEVRTINQEIQLVQIEKFINDFNTTMKKDLKKQFKNIFFVLAPFILSIISFLIFKNPYLIVFGICITGISGVVEMSKEAISQIKNMNNKNNNSNIIKLEDEKSVEQILEEGIKINGEDLYTQKYKLAVKREKSYSETEEYKKYKEAVEKQKHKTNSNIKIVGSDESYLNKEETMIQLIREMDTYILVYKLPPLTISSDEWDLFFDIMYDIFQKKGIENKFYESISQIEKYVLAKALVYKKRKISMYDFVENLYYLENSIINEKELDAAKEYILSKLPHSTSIDFSKAMVKTKIR